MTFFTSPKGVGPSEWWTLFLLGSIYTVGELGHFLLGSVSRAMATELHFGDKACLKFPNATQISSSHCADITDQLECENVRVVDEDGRGISPCEWTYNGLGLEYHILAGPAFMAVYTVSAIAWGYLADKKNRVHCLSVAAFFFSAAIVGTGLSTSYWHVFISRMALAAGESSCHPLATSIIADLFPKRNRGLAMGLFHWGIYIGYGSSFAIGNHITAANIMNMGWRASYVLSGLPGFVAALLFYFTAKEPQRTLSEEEEEAEKNCKAEKGSLWQLAWTTMKNPALIFLVMGACIRHAGGFCWGYNSALYFKTYYPDYDASLWLSVISICAGIFGVFIGGILSDALVGKLGVSARAMVLFVSQLMSSPFAFAQLFVGPPLALYFLIGAYVTAEFWFGVMFALLVELVPSEIRSKSVAVALFCINNIGGNTPVLVDPITHRFNYRIALTILYPGALFTSSVLFFVCWIILVWQSRRSSKQALK